MQPHRFALLSLGTALSLALGGCLLVGYEQSLSNENAEIDGSLSANGRDGGGPGDGDGLDGAVDPWDLPDASLGCPGPNCPCQPGQVLCDGDHRYVCAEDGSVLEENCALGLDACEAPVCTQAGCDKRAKGDGERCDDGVFCTADDVCQDGECVGSGDPCEDNECGRRHCQGTACVVDQEFFGECGVDGQCIDGECVGESCGDECHPECVGASAICDLPCLDPELCSAQCGQSQVCNLDCADSENCLVSCDSVLAHCNLDCIDGKNCEATCTPGVCDTKCEGAAHCTTECSGMGSECPLDCDGATLCEQTCSSSARCTASCQNAEQCRSECFDRGKCVSDCRGATECSANCGGNSHCEIDCRDAEHCQIACDATSTCTLQCSPGAADCKFSECPGGEQTCPSGLIVCQGGC